MLRRLHLYLRAVERKTLFYWLAQLGGWGAYYVFSVVLLLETGAFQMTDKVVPWILANIAFSVLISHALRFVIVRWNWLGLKLAKLIIFSIVLAFIASVLLEFFQHYLEYIIPRDFEVGTTTSLRLEFSWSSFFFAASRSLILFLLWMGFYYTFVIIEKSRKQEIANLQYEASRNEIELKNLLAQLNPHFLFNSLNSIRALVGLDPEQAKVAITRLSSLLRQSINLGKMQVVSLKEEFDLVKSYLDLEQLRFEERLKLKFDISENSLKCEIPPLMVQTLVENSIKHGISKAMDGGCISISSSYENNILQLEIRNTGKFEPGENGGVGIANTRKRLEILFGSNATFDIAQDGKDVSVTIEIKYS